VDYDGFRYNGDIMVQTINAAELADLLSRSTVDVVDVRDHHEWNAGHIAGSRVIPLETLRADPDVHLVHGAIIVFICAKGVRSLAAAKLAERFGYEHVYNLEGGSKEWARAGMPLVVEERVAA
jgi:rhodanese-related sulfurtransferase